MRIQNRQVDPVQTRMEAGAPDDTGERDVLGVIGYRLAVVDPGDFPDPPDTLTAYDTFAGGGGFGGDGYLLVSDQTFLSLFPARSSGAPDHILLRLRPGAQPDAVAARLKELIADPTLRIRSYADAMDEEVRFQQTQRPTGVIFGFGVLIGVLVGIVIVFQVLSADVADHLREYLRHPAQFHAVAEDLEHLRPRLGASCR